MWRGFSFAGFKGDETKGGQGVARTLRGGANAFEALAEGCELEGAKMIAHW